MADFREIEVRLIDDPEIATRIDIDDQELDDLAADIKANGLYYPLIVRATGDRFEVVDGHRRLLAVRRLGWIAVTCKVQGDDAPPPEEVKLKTNMLRVQNNDAELAVYIGELVEKRGYNMEQLMKATGMKEAWINERYALLKGDSDVLAALNAREINFSQAKVLNRCRDKSWRDMGLHYAKVDNLPADRLREWLVRNELAQTTAANPQPQPEPTNGLTEVLQSGIVCSWCGQTNNPEQMLNLWLHRWEYDLVMKIRDGYMQPREG